MTAQLCDDITTTNLTFVTVEDDLGLFGYSEEMDNDDLSPAVVNTYSKSTQVQRQLKNLLEILLSQLRSSICHFLCLGRQMLSADGYRRKSTLNKLEQTVTLPKRSLRREEVWAELVIAVAER